MDIIFPEKLLAREILPKIIPLASLSFNQAFKK